MYGLDLEWPVIIQKGITQPKTALIQICGFDTILLFQTSKLDCKLALSNPYFIRLTLSAALPVELVQFLEDPMIFKAGVKVFNDGRKLQRDFGVVTNGLIELGDAAKSIDSPLLEKTSLRSLSVFINLFVWILCECSGNILICFFFFQIVQKQVTKGRCASQGRMG